MQTTVGQLLVNDVLPDKYKDHERALTGDNLTELLAQIGREDPDLYREISQKLMQMGAKASYTEGTTISLEDLATPDPAVRKEVFDFVDKQEEVIRKAKDMTDEEKQIALSTVYAAAQKKLIDGTMGAAVAQENPLALQILSKARGNPGQLTAITASPGVYTDAKDEIVPLFVRRSYAEGLSPAEYYAATFGTRKGVISTKFATRDAGDFGKQLNTAAADLIVTEEDCGTANGIPVSVEDKDSIGALLAKDVSGYKSEAPVTGRMLNKLENDYEKIVVRSPITCQAKGGVCKKCVGLRENGRLPELRQAVGIQAASALAERIAQGSLNVKHAGGQASGGGEKVYAGFPIINQIGQIPKTFRHKATLADVDGDVSKIEQAPQGGTNIYIGDTVHYVEPEQEVNVKEGENQSRKSTLKRVTILKLVTNFLQV
jgi:DNA-directed RNA polymerase subunit beta'